MRTHRKPPEVVPNAARLRSWLEGPPRRTQAGLVAWIRELGVDVSQQSVSAWLCSRAVPDGDVLRQAIDRITGGEVPADGWHTDSERKALARIQAYQPDSAVA